MSIVKAVLVVIVILSIVVEEIFPYAHQKDKMKGLYDVSELTKMSCGFAYFQLLFQALFRTGMTQSQQKTYLYIYRGY